MKIISLFLIRFLIIDAIVIYSMSNCLRTVEISIKIGHGLPLHASPCLVVLDRGTFFHD